MGNLSARARLLLWMAKWLGRHYVSDDVAEPPRTFVLLSKQRSGSTWLMDLLDSHPQVRVYAELFHSGGYGRPRVGRNRDILYWNSYAALHPTRNRMEKLRLYFRYLDVEVFRKRPDGEAVGFKLMYNQAATELGLLAYLSVRGVSAIHLIRRNHLDAILSEEASLIRGVAHAESGAVVDDVRIDLDTLTLLDRLEQRDSEIRAASEFLVAENIPHHEVAYEDLLAGLAALKPIQRFLDVQEYASLSSNLTKINPTSHRRLIRNHAEVQETLAGTRFASLLR